MNIDLYKAFLINKNYIDYYDKYNNENDDHILSKYNYNFACDNKIELKPNMIPYGVKKVVFQDDFNQILKKDYIPSSVKIIKFNYIYNHPFNNFSFSNGLIELHLPAYYNHELKIGVIPNTVKILNLGNFNKELKIGVIPNSVTKLIIHDTSMRYHDMYNSYNHELSKGIIPDSVIELHLKYNKTLVEGIIPKNVKKLYLTISNKLKKRDIPDSVEILSLTISESLDKDVIPNSVKELHLYFINNYTLNEGDIPNSVTKLWLFNYRQILKKGDIPNSVIELLLDGYDFELKKDMIPFGVISLTLSRTYNEPLNKNCIPDSVRTLEISNKMYSYTIDTNNLSNNLYELILFNKNIKIINDRNILIGYFLDSNYYHKFIEYDNFSIVYNRLFDNMIEFINIKFKGQIIGEELVKKVFNPYRLLKLCNIYNIELVDLVDIY